MTIRLLSLIMAVSLLVSCGKESADAIGEKSAQTSSVKLSKEIAKGPLSKIYIIADEQLWNQEMQDSVIYYFQSAFPLLPAPEPLYDLMRYSTQEILAKKERRHLRTYLLLADLNDPDSKATKMALRDIGEARVKDLEKAGNYKLIIGKDKWAEGQTIVYAMGYGKKNIFENIRKNFNTIDKAIRKGEFPKRQKSIYLAGTNSDVVAELKKTMNLSIRIPSDYFLAMNDKEESVAWIRRESSKASFNIMIKDMGSFKEQEFSKEGMKKIRNELGLYVSSDKEDSYMIINDIDLPTLMSSTSFNNNFALEAKGIWELENDFMGGPYVSYIVHNPNSDRVLFIDGFVHAPGENKRGLMLQLEHIIKSLSF